jgi:hypothetical protein
VTQEDIDRWGEAGMREDTEMELERVLDDPEARFRIAGPAPKTNFFAENPPTSQPKPERPKPAEAARPKPGKKGSWLDRLLGR